MKRFSPHILVSAMLVSLSTAHAWKPITHNYIAEQALRDALDDGYITIPVLVRGEPQNPPVTRTYAVDPTLLQALRQNTPQYRAGVMGPDAYPDIMTGQQVIHPATDANIRAERVEKNGGPANTVHKGSNDWLTYLWTSGQQASSPAEKAFVTGYMTHAAGDMFGHTFINNYAGAPFTINPVDNAVRHVVSEGYVGKRTPKLLKYDRSLSSNSSINASDFVTSGQFVGPQFHEVFVPSGDVSIDGVETFIYDKMIDITSNPALGALYSDRLNEASIPFVYSKARAELQKHINWYHTERDWLRQKINSCKWYDVWCFNKYNALYLVHTTVVYGTKQYADAWIKDIDAGLKAWPRVSHEIALQLILPTADGDPKNASISPARFARADEVAQNYVFNHLASMSGAPDQAGPAAQWVLGFIDRIFNSPDFIKRLKKNLIDQIILNATNKTRAEWKELVSNPELSFDRVMNVTGQGRNSLSLSEMNQTILNLPASNNGQQDLGYQFSDMRFSIDTFSPAYNTLVMSKLVLLSPSEFSRFVQDLPFKGARPSTPLPANAMLGFIDSLDGREDSQNARVGSGIYNDCEAYNAVFKPQIGDDLCTRSAPPAATVPADPTGFDASPDSAHTVALSWNAVTSGVTGYKLERRSATSSTFTQIATPAANAGAFMDSNRPARATFVYRLKAVNGIAQSNWIQTQVTMPDEAPCRVAPESGKVAPASAPEGSPDFVPPC